MPPKRPGRMKWRALHLRRVALGVAGLGVAAGAVLLGCYVWIHLDGGCLRTMDSIFRAKSVFGLDQFIVVSQKFHNQRAIYLGRQHQLDIVGYNARDVGWRDGYRTLAREYLSRPQALLDLHLRRRGPEPSEPRIGIGVTPPGLGN